jgi:Tol biopolymer transport system component
LLCGLVLLSGCANKLWPSEQGFPDREIVFENTSGSHRGVLGFIHPDGTGVVTRTVFTGLDVELPTWSPDGKFIAIQTGSEINSQRVVSHDGYLRGECRKWVWSWRRSWVTTDGYLLFRLNHASTKQDTIVLGDFHSCKIQATLFQSSDTTDVAFLESPHLSLQGWLAVNRVLLNEGYPAKAEIIVVDPATQEREVIVHGREPTWSRDGEWLAYTTLDGIYIVRKDGTEAHKLVDIDSRSESYPGTSKGIGWYDWFPAPSWSPDGKWLVYHRVVSDEAVIYKVNVESGEEIEIYKGGIYPNWRWDSSIMDE